jgi:TolB-like protein
MLGAGHPAHPVLRTLRYVIAAAVVLAAAAGPTGAQCPDGSPPPYGRAGAVAAFARSTPPPSARSRSFLVLPFRNLSRAPEHDWLGEASPTMLADALGQWRELSVVPDELLYAALRRHGLRGGDVIELQRVRPVAAETGGWTAVMGEIVGLPGRLRVSLRAYDVVTQRLVARASAEVALSADVRAAYDSLATELLHTAGVGVAIADLGAATTRSFDAYREYLRGREPPDAYAAAVGLLSGTSGGPMAWVVLPGSLKAKVREALQREVARATGDALLALWLRALATAPSSP